MNITNALCAWYLTILTMKLYVFLSKDQYAPCIPSVSWTAADSTKHIHSRSDLHSVLPTWITSSDLR